MWEGEARNDKLPEEIVQATAATLKAYADRTPEERLESLKALWKNISDKVPEAALTKKQSPAKSAPHPSKAQQQTNAILTPPQTAQVEPQIKPIALLAPPTQVEPKPTPMEEQSVPEPEAPPETSLTPREPMTSMGDQKTIDAAQAMGAETAAPSQSTKPEPAKPRAPARTVRPRGAAPSRAEAHPGGVTSKRPIALNASLTVLAGVGPRHAAMLTRLGLNTLGDMLYNYPHRYEDYSQLKPIRDVFYGAGSDRDRRGHHR